MGPPSYMLSVVELSVVMRRFIVLNVYKFFHSCPINPLFSSLYTQLEQYHYGSVRRASQLPSVSISLSALCLFPHPLPHICNFLQFCEQHGQVGNTRLWFVNDCLLCLPEGWLSWTGNSRCFAQSPRDSLGQYHTLIRDLLRSMSLPFIIHQ